MKYLHFFLQIAVVGGSINLGIFFPEMEPPRIGLTTRGCTCGMRYITKVQLQIWRGTISGCGVTSTGFDWLTRL